MKEKKISPIFTIGDEVIISNEDNALYKSIGKIVTIDGPTHNPFSEATILFHRLYLFAVLMYKTNSIRTTHLHNLSLIENNNKIEKHSEDEIGEYDEEW